MADEQQREIIASNPLLGPLDANEEASAIPTRTEDNHPSPPLSSREETHEKPAHQKIVEHHRQDLPKKNVLNLWWMELLSIIFSLMCLATNVGVLRAINNKEYKSWKIARVNITPNTIVSIIATLTKASLLLTVAEVIAQLKWLCFQARAQRISDLQVFDDACRGPLGRLIEI